MEKAKSTGNFSTSAVSHNPVFDKEEEEEAEEAIKNSQSGQITLENPEEPFR